MTFFFFFWKPRISQPTYSLISTHALNLSVQYKWWCWNFYSHHQGLHFLLSFFLKHESKIKIYGHTYCTYIQPLKQNIYIITALILISVKSSSPSLSQSSNIISVMMKMKDEKKKNIKIFKFSRLTCVCWIIWCCFGIVDDILTSCIIEVMIDVVFHFFYFEKSFTNNKSYNNKCVNILF